MPIVNNALLKRLRKEKKLTQEQLAVKTGLARSYITRIELGDLEPSLTTLKRIAKVLGTELKELIK